MEFKICGVPFLGPARPRCKEILSLNKATFTTSGICIAIILLELFILKQASEVLDIK